MPQFTDSFKQLVLVLAIGAIVAGLIYNQFTARTDIAALQGEVAGVKKAVSQPTATPVITASPSATATPEPTKRVLRVSVTPEPTN